MKRFQWLILLLLVTAFRGAAQDQAANIAPPSIKLVAITLLVRDYDKPRSGGSSPTVMEGFG